MAKSAKSIKKKVTNEELLQESFVNTGIVQNRIVKCEIASKDANAFSSVVMNQIRLYDRLKKCSQTDKAGAVKAMQKIVDVASKYVD